MSRPDQMAEKTVDLTATSRPTGPEIRPLTRADTSALRAFFGRIPEGDRTFFRDDVLDPATIDAWLADSQVVRRVAVAGDDIVGYLAVHPLVGWSRHVGEVRVVVDATHRRIGVGRALARQGLLEGLALGLAKLVVEVATEQESTVSLFASLGFAPEALLRGHVRDADGTLHDLFVMAHVVNDTWSAMETIGMDELAGE